MIFPDTLEEKLGVDQIRQRLKSFCLSTAGAAWIDRMRFGTDAEFIKILLRQNLEFKQILEKSENFPSQHFFDGEEWLKRISLEGNYLEAEEFLKLARALETIINSRTFLSKAKEIYPQLYQNR
jgi:DNA mismatch repair protein MutS2